jgi:hypothetical protein
MDNPSLTSAHRLDGFRAYGRAADAFETVAWKAPSATRFQNHVANGAPEPKFRDVVQAMPGWIVIAGGGVIAALTGAMLGGMLQV